MLIPLACRFLTALALTALVAGCGPGLIGASSPYVATPESVGVEMLRLAGVGPADIVYDLGSGDGRLVVAAAREFGATGVGVELDPNLIQTSRENAAKAGVASRTRFLWQDLFTTDFHEATVVTLYLNDEVNLRLRPKLLRDLRPGSRVVSHDFSMGDWPPDRLQRVRGPSRMHTVYVWFIPGALAGRWQLTFADAEARPATLELTQRFQLVKGTLDMEGRRSAAEGSLEGGHFQLTADAQTFTGEVNGTLATGRLTTRDGVREWTARRMP
jgi:SAM-dependent methyltransferase